MSKKKSKSAKWRVFEELTAAMYRMPGVKVEQNVRLVVRSSSGRKRTREIDVLVTGSLAGVPIRIPIECKDEKGPVGVQKIGIFIDKLDEVGLSCRPSAFVSANGFTQGALDRAKEVGIITRVLKEITRATAAEMIENALQRVVFLLPQITSLSWQDNVPDYTSITKTPQDAFFAFAFFNRGAQFKGTVPDLVWRRWMEGEPPSEIGEHTIHIGVPDGWHRYVQGKTEEPILAVTAKVAVVGLVLETRGVAKTHALLDPITGLEDRRTMAASFPTPQGRLPMQMYRTEQDLSRYLAHREGADLLVSVGRFRLPRLVFGAAYWPLSAKANQRIQELVKQHGDLPAGLTLADIEGTNLNAVWDPLLEN